jgi:hypothetical protein
MCKTNLKCLLFSKESKAIYEEARQVKRAFKHAQRMLRSSASQGRSRKTRDSLIPHRTWLADLKCQGHDSSIVTNMDMYIARFTLLKSVVFAELYSDASLRWPSRVVRTWDGHIHVGAPPVQNQSWYCLTDGIDGNHNVSQREYKVMVG